MQRNVFANASLRFERNELQTVTLQLCGKCGAVFLTKDDISRILGAAYFECARNVDALSSRIALYTLHVIFFFCFKMLHAIMKIKCGIERNRLDRFHDSVLSILES